MTVNPAELQFYKKLSEKNSNKPSKPLNEMTLAESRVAIKNSFLAIDPSNTQLFIDETVMARDGHAIPIRIYNHDLPASTPILIYLMGNGYIYDLFKVNALICSRIAEYSSIKVAIINTRLAPESPLPTSIYDGYDAIKYMVNHAQHYAINPEHIILSGYCTGAASAAVIVDHAHKDNAFKIQHLILLNGLYDLFYSHNQFSEYENMDVSISKEMFEYIVIQQNISEACKADAMYSPIFNDQYDHFPPVTIIVAEYDRNRSSSEAYYDKLNRHGVAVKKIVLSGQTHNTIIFQNQITNTIDPALVIANIIEEI